MGQKSPLKVFFNLIIGYTAQLVQCVPHALHFNHLNIINPGVLINNFEDFLGSSEQLIQMLIINTNFLHVCMQKKGNKLFQLKGHYK